MSRLVKVSDSFQRPANTTQYAATDLVANSATAGSVEPLTFQLEPGGFHIKRIELMKTDEADVTAADFDVIFYDSANPISTAVGDNANWTKASTGYDGYMAQIDLPTMTAASDEASTVVNLGDSGFTEGLYGYSSNGKLQAFIINDGTYTPASAETFQLTLVIECFGKQTG